MDLVQLFTHFNAFYIRNVSFKQLVRHIFARFLFFFIFYLLNIKVLLNYLIHLSLHRILHVCLWHKVLFKIESSTHGST